MEIVGPYIHFIILAIEFISILVLIWGVLLCTKRFLNSIFNSNHNNPAQYQIMAAKIELGRYVLLGLEILIIADIIASIVNPNMQDILRLASIVAIRTVISFFLNKEIEATNKELADAEEKK